MTLATASAGATLRSICPAYREAALAYDRAFEKGDVRAIDEAFSRMQQIESAFDQGARWARRQHAGYRPAPRGLR